VAEKEGMGAKKEGISSLTTPECARAEHASASSSSFSSARKEEKAFSGIKSPRSFGGAAKSKREVTPLVVVVVYFVVAGAKRAIFSFQRARHYRGMAPHAAAAAAVIRAGNESVRAHLPDERDGLSAASMYSYKPGGNVIAS